MFRFRARGRADGDGHEWRRRRLAPRVLGVARRLAVVAACARRAARIRRAACPPPRLRSSRGCMHDICARVAPPLPPFSPPLTRSMFAIFFSFFLPLLSTPAGRRAAMSPSTTRATRAQRTRRSSKARETASCERSKMGRRQLSRVVAEEISAEARGTSRAHEPRARVRAVLRTRASCNAAHVCQLRRCARARAARCAHMRAAQRTSARAPRSDETAKRLCNGRAAGRRGVATRSTLCNGVAARGERGGQCPKQAA